MNYSISDIIKMELKRQGRSKAWLARDLGENNPQNLYQKLDKSDLDSGLIMRISIALEHDFFADLSKQYKREIFNVEKVMEDASVGLVMEDAPEGLIDKAVEQAVARALKKRGW